MNPRAGMLIAAGALVAGTVTVLPTTATASATASPATGPGSGQATRPNARAAAPLAWTGCATKTYPKLQCATLKVPLNHDVPRGRSITLALTRVAHTAKRYQGPLLVNPGGPGGSGRGMAGYVAAALPADVAAQYDVIGFDPRGVGKSEPALDCRPGHFDPVRPDSVPRDPEGEQAGVERAQAFATACGKKYADVLPYIDTVSTARDMDVLRRALGAPKINYLGYSYGTYLGAVYARLFPERVRRFALDSVVNPHGVWYEDNIAQDYAFDSRHKAFTAWVARNDATYRLGTEPAAVEAAWYRMREELRTEPAGGKVGPVELEDTFLPGGYYNGYWPRLASAFASYVNDADTAPLVKAYEAYAAADSAADNGYSVYASVQCRDAAWPRDWNVWRQDNWDAHTKAPFSTWNNAWYNAPCAFWPVESLTPPDLTNDQVPPMLILQATDDAATPYEGGAALHGMVRDSSLVVEQGGGNHGVTLAGNDCMDEHLTTYLRTGEVPRGAEGAEADAVCATLPEPEAATTTTTRAAAPPAGATLHGLLGHVR
ncbi:alpha/beta hydrolase [Streptomyces sp. NPDC085481]|uniref:alpha/beta hydrolase n=1 Tax=Streptomyces sp. NPDC085481 TaxID=3365727 RepID=UPI0037D48F54